MTVLVTGGKGYLGAAVIRRLVELNNDVICLDVKTTPGRLGEVADKVTFIGGGLRDASSLAEIMQEYGVRFVAHMVYMTSNSNPASLHDEIATMVMGTAEVLEAARRSDVGRVFFPSSIACYGPQWLHGEKWLDERAPSLARNVYGISKRLNEAVAREYVARCRMSVVSFRLPAIYGPGAKVGARGVNMAPTAAARGEATTLPYGPDQHVCMAHVGDAADLIVRALVGGSPRHLIYNVGGHVVTYDEIARIVTALIPGALIDFASDERSDLAYLIDDARARAEFGLRHRPLKDGIVEVINETRRASGMSPLPLTGSNEMIGGGSCN